MPSAGRDAVPRRDDRPAGRRTQRDVELGRRRDPRLGRQDRGRVGRPAAASVEREQREERAEAHEVTAARQSQEPAGRRQPEREPDLEDDERPSRHAMREADREQRRIPRALDPGAGRHRRHAHGEARPGVPCHRRVRPQAQDDAVGRAWQAQPDVFGAGDGPALCGGPLTTGYAGAGGQCSGAASATSDAPTAACIATAGNVARRRSRSSAPGRSEPRSASSETRSSTRCRGTWRRGRSPAARRRAGHPAAPPRA